MTVAIAMVALSKSAKIAGGGVPKAWGARWPNSPAPTDAAKKDNTLAFRVGKYQFIYGLMPAPIPWSDLEFPCAHSPFWPDAAAKMRPHERHVIVSVIGEGDQTERMQILTQATVALVDVCDGAIGVFWCNSLLVLPPKQFCEIACQFSPKAPPLPLWVNFVIGKNPDGSTRGATKGLAALGLMEFETHKSAEPPAELRKRLLGLAAYVIENGLVIKDGDTIGENVKERIKVTYGPSAFGGSGQVMQLDYRSGDASGSRMTAYGYIHSPATLLCTIGFGYFLYVVFPVLRGSIFRHFLIVPLALVFGLMLLVISDRLLQKTFGLEAFAEPKSR